MDPYNGKTFAVTESHIKLLKEMYVSWDGGEFGAPSIDCKRPYGNSYVYGDIGEILGIKPDDNDEFSDEQQAEMDEIHQQMQTVLQILVSNANLGVQPGVYERENAYSKDWKRKS